MVLLSFMMEYLSRHHTMITSDDARIWISFLESKKTVPCYCVEISSDEFGKYLDAQLLADASAYLYAVKICVDRLEESAEFFLKMLKRERDLHQILFACCLSIIGVTSTEDKSKDIEYFNEFFDEEDHLNAWFYRLAKLLSEDNNLGNKTISANIELSDFFLEKAREKEDEHQIEVIGYDSDYTSYIVSLIVGWDENNITFFDYDTLDNKCALVKIESLSVSDDIIEKTKMAGFYTIKDINNMPKTDFVEKTKMDKSSAEALQKILRDYYAHHYWSEHNKTLCNS